MSIIGAVSNFAHSTTGRVALVGGGLAVAAVTLTACGSPRVTPTEHRAQMLGGVRDASQGHLDVLEGSRLVDAATKELGPKLQTYETGTKVGRLFLTYEAQLGDKGAALTATTRHLHDYAIKDWV
ncbi:MAG: hypothetical protein JWM98_574 [Thermoleophilia bacterium]|nr:hypothetical protein [Thermoleophilia bacterium]